MAAAASLGEFEQVVLLAILRLGENAYGVTIGAEIKACAGREPAPGALYTTLDRLEDKGLVSSLSGDPTPQRGGRAKRYFTLSPKGLLRRSRARNGLIAGCWRAATSPELPMRGIDVAEWILALVTSRDRAASTAGDLAEARDLTEGAAARGAVWFWFSVLRTAASLLWRDVAEKSACALGLAFLGMAILMAVDYLCAALNGVAFFIVAYRTGRPLHLGSIGWIIWFNAPLLWTSLGIGRMLAR